MTSFNSSNSCNAVLQPIHSENELETWLAAFVNIRVLSLDMQSICAEIWDRNMSLAKWWNSSIVAQIIA